MRSTPLHDWHLEHQACMVDFAGWHMPVYYPTGAVKEHELCRSSVGLFDIDHMGQFLVSGPDSGAWLSGRISRRVDDLEPGRSRYALLLAPDGGVFDDLFVYRLGEREWFVVANAGNREADFALLRGALPPGGAVALRDVSDDYAMIAVQGPKAIALLDAYGWTEDGALSPKEHHGQGCFADLERLGIARAVVAGVPCLAARTGYTGEDGAELYCPASRMAEVWNGLLAAADKAGIAAGPVGLAARDSLRFEAGMPLHGHEISPAINPVEALLSWACDFEHDYPGRAAVEAMKARGPARKLATVGVSGGVPREGTVLVAWPEGAPAPAPDAPPAGAAVCGLFCPSAKAYACNAFLPPELAVPGTRLGAVIRGQVKEAVVLKRPLYQPVYRR